MKKSLFDISPFIFIIVTIMVIVGGIHISEKIDNDVALAEQARMEAELAEALIEHEHQQQPAYSSNDSISKDARDNVAKQLVLFFSKYDIDYINFKVRDNTIYYEITINPITYYNLLPTVSDYELLLNKFYTRIKSAWVAEGIDIDISLSLIDCRDHEITLLISENSEIVYNCYDSAHYMSYEGD